MTDYQIAWLVYLSAAVLFMTMFWFATRNLRFTLLRDVLRLTLAVVLLVPSVVVSQPLSISPAIMAVAIGVVINNQEQAISNGLLLVVTWVLLFILVIARRFFKRSPAAG